MFGTSNKNKIDNLSPQKCNSNKTHIPTEIEKARKLINCIIMDSPQDQDSVMRTSKRYNLGLSSSEAAFLTNMTNCKVHIIFR